MAIHVIGDIHGNFKKLFKLIHDISEEDSIIQVGDFGVWPQLRDKYMKTRWSIPDQRRGQIFFIDGNHDYIPMLPVDSLEMVEIWSGLWYIPRGYVGYVEDKRVLFLGGSKSVDRKWRPKDSTEHGWFEAEQLNLGQALRAVEEVGESTVDLIISHSPPDWINRRHLSPDGLRHFDIDPETWVDESALFVEQVWKKIGSPRLICGHIHKSFVDGPIKVLGIDEIYKVP